MSDGSVWRLRDVSEVRFTRSSTPVGSVFSTCSCGRGATARSAHALSGTLGKDVERNAIAEHTRSLRSLCRLWQSCPNSCGAVGSDGWCTGHLRGQRHVLRRVTATADRADRRVAAALRSRRTRRQTLASRCERNAARGALDDQQPRRGAAARAAVRLGVGARDGRSDARRRASDRRTGHRGDAGGDAGHDGAHAPVNAGPAAGKWRGAECAAPHDDPVALAGEPQRGHAGGQPARGRAAP